VALKMRLRRVGAKKQPSYRIVIADARAPRDGRFVEIIGHYNPLTEPRTVVINAERALYWLRNGAQPTEVVHKMLVQQGVWARYQGQEVPEIPAILPVVVPVVEPEAAPIPVDETPAPVEAEAVPVEETAAVVEAVATPVEEAAAVVEETPAAEETPAE